MPLEIGEMCDFGWADKALKYETNVNTLTN